MLEMQCMGCMEMYDGDLNACPHCGFKESEYKRIGYHLAPHSTLIDTYIVGKAIGYGGFGVTYVGYNAILEKKVAIKEYLPGEFATRSPGETTVTAFTGDKEQAYYKGLEQFEYEAKRLASLKNKDGIVDIYDSFRANNTVYIVMECLEGETLKSMLKREKKLSEKKATNIIVAVLKALKGVHSEGIIHRDISPENIFITTEGEVKLIDFGAARNATTGLSKSLSVIVKQGYAPPEQYFSKGNQGSWTDVYAAAATYYKMLTGITPEDSMERNGEDTLVPPSKLKVKLSKKQENALLNAMELNVKDRTATVDEFLKGIIDNKAKVKRTKAKKEKVDLGKLSLKAKLGIGLGVVAVVLAFVIGYQVVRVNLISDQEMLAKNQVYVPNVLNMSYEDAVSLLETEGLNTRVVSWKSYDNVPGNTVVGQNVQSGQLVDKGIEIGLTVSNNGGDNVFLGDYVGIHKDEALAMLDELQLYVELEEVESAFLSGYIVSQDTPPNEPVKKGNIIKLQVSTGLSNYGDGMVKVPNLVGCQLEDCLELLADKGLHIVKEKITYSKDIPQGEVISQNFTEGSEVSAGTTVEVEVSGGVQMVRIPALNFSDVLETKQRLEELGFNVEIEYVKGYSADELDMMDDETLAEITSKPLASVSADDLVEAGSTVTLYTIRGITITTDIIEPENKYGNVYSVGDEIRVTFQISYEAVGMNNGWDMELGLNYNMDMLEFKDIEGGATVEYGVDHSKCGNWSLVETLARNHVLYTPPDDNYLTIYYSFEGEVTFEKTITLVFEAKEKGEDILYLFMVSTPKDYNEAYFHMWPQENIYHEFYHTSNHDDILCIEIR